MSRLLGLLLAAALAAPVAAQRDPIGRLYFDHLGNDGAQNSPRSGPTAQENPQLPDGGGRLFVYWQFGHVDQLMHGVGVDIDISDGLITEAYYYNPVFLPGVWRWGFVTPNPPSRPDAASVRYNGFDRGAVSLRNGAGFEAIDYQFDPHDGPFGSTLLGYIDVVNDPGRIAEAYFSGNGLGIAEVGGHDDDVVYFGFGDEAVNTRTGISAIADATIVPEPGGLMLLCVGLAGLLRRR